MILAILQILLVLAAGVALFLLWRAATPSQPWLRLVVAAGFLARALIGQALFWISWARLPIARGLQLGDGIWFFAEDAFLYVPAAASAAGKGVWAIVMIPRVEPSVMYIQALSAAMLLFGRAASVALLLNLFCYLGMVALLLRWGRNEPSAQTAVAVAIAGISLSPAVMLWSLQPLKDTFFQFLFVAFVFACAAWQQAWVTRGPARTRIAIGLLLPVLLYAIAGIRWYFAFAVLIATSIFLLLVVFRTSERRLGAFGAVVMVFLLSRALYLGAEPYLPPAIAEALRPSTAVAAVVKLPTYLVRDVESARTSFDRAGGRTSIQSGARPAPPPALPAPANPEAAAARAVLDAHVAAWNRGDFDAFLAAYANSPDVMLAQGETVIRGHAEIAGVLRQSFPLQPEARGTLTLSDLSIALTGQDQATATGYWHLTRSSGPALHGSVNWVLRRFPDEGWKVIRTTVPPMQMVRAIPSVATAPSPSPSAAPRPPSRTMRLITNAAVIVLPRSVGERLGLFHIGGGRGMFWFTELDTLVFDLALLCAIAALSLRFRPSLRDPLAWLVVLLTLLVGVPLVYTVSNFGTLFRLREMIYVGLLLAPVAAAAAGGTSTPFNR